MLVMLLVMVLTNRVKVVALAIYQRIRPIHHYLMLIGQFDDGDDDDDVHSMLMVMIDSVNLVFK